MDWLDKFNVALDYIEKNLDCEIEYEKIARAACCSEFHFARMFSTMAGVSLSEYIRRRRLTKAAFDLQTSELKIIDISLKYGYESPDAFARAFRKMHGVSPNKVKDKGSGVKLKAYPRISFQITMKGDSEMEYRIEEIPFESRFVGKQHSVKMSRAFKEIPSLWQKAKKSDFLHVLLNMSGNNPESKFQGVVGICSKEDTVLFEDFHYFMGACYKGSTPEGMEEFVVPPCTYAVFYNIPETWTRLYSEWLPISGYELANAPCIEHFIDYFNHELWIPIINRK